MSKDADQEFSVAHFFTLFEKAVKKVNRYPLTIKNLVVQKDAYARLATDDDTALYEPFAVLECTKKERDTDIPFRLELYPEGFLVHAEYLSPIGNRYHDLFATEKAAVKQIIDLLVVLSNGQLSLLFTKLDSEVCAVELLFKDKDAKIPLVLHTDANYPWWLRTDTPEEVYDTSVHQNQYKIPPIEASTDFFILPHYKNGDFAASGRMFNSSLRTPLTKERYRALKYELDAQFIGKALGQDTTLFLYKHWEFWLFTALIVSVVAWILSLKILPQAFSSHFVWLLIPVLLIGYAILGLLLGYKRNLQLSKKNHPYIILDRFLTKIWPGNSRLLKIQRATETESDVQRRLAGRLLFARKLEFLGWMTNGVMMAFSAYVFTLHMPVAILTRGNPTGIGVVMGLEALFALIFSYSVRNRWTSDYTNGRLAYIIFVLNVCIPAAMAKDEGGPGLGYVFSYGAAIILIGVTSFRNVQVNKLKSLEISGLSGIENDGTTELNSS